MILTPLGLAFLLIGLIVLFTASRQAMLGYVLVTALFNGSASLMLPALGNTSIQPALVATGLLALRCALPDCRAPGQLAASLAANGWLVLFVGWGFLGAYTLPFVFAGDIAVVPLRPTGSPTGLETHPLRFTPQNVTTSCYLLATLAASLCAWIVAGTTGAAARIARLASMVALAHAAIGWLALATGGTPLAGVIALLRNGAYMQLDQSFGGFGRITGISPEPSLYVSFGFAWLVFTAELWLRHVDRRWSGPAALALLATLIASTSTTAYVGLGAYALLLTVRLAGFAGAIPPGKGLVLTGLALALLSGGLAATIGSDGFAEWIGRTARMTTIDKLGSVSGVARLFWARQGLDLFLASGGLGVGVGSFRSSSLTTAIAGSGGVIALAAFALHLARLLRPLPPTGPRAGGDPTAEVGTAAAWAAVVMLVPAAVSAPSPDPGLIWGIIAGSALGLRRTAFAQGHKGRTRQRAITSISALSGAAPGRAGGYASGMEGMALAPGRLV